MGMRLVYLSVSDAEANRLRSDPDLAPSLLLGDELSAALPGLLSHAPAAVRQAMGSHAQAALFPRLVRDDDDANDAAANPQSRSAGVRGELEKAWHGLHFVLTGRANEAPAPLGYLLSGGEEVGDDCGYGAARLLNSSEVVAFRDALSAIRDEDFDQRFSLQELARAQVYPGIWDEDRNELLEEYQMYFEQLKRDVGQVAAAQDGLLIALL